MRSGGRQAVGGALDNRLIQRSASRRIVSLAEGQSAILKAGKLEPPDASAHPAAASAILPHSYRTFDSSAVLVYDLGYWTSPALM